MNARRAVLAIDHGKKHTGFAVVDALRIAAHPLPAWHASAARAELLDHVAALLGERDVDTLLLGLPRTLDGLETARAAEVRRFGRELAARFPALEVLLHDEALSTKEADALLVEAGYTGEARKARTDSWSALVVLRDWIAAGEPRSERVDSDRDSSARD